MFMSAVMVDRHKTESDPVPCLKPNPPPRAAAAGQCSGVHRVGRRGPRQVPAYTVLGQHQTRRHTGGGPPAGACARAASRSWRRGPTQPGFGSDSTAGKLAESYAGLRGERPAGRYSRLLLNKAEL
jgi:hypothetical protein